MLDRGIRSLVTSILQQHGLPTSGHGEKVFKLTWRGDDSSSKVLTALRHYGAMVKKLEAARTALAMAERARAEALAAARWDAV